MFLVSDIKEVISTLPDEFLAVLPKRHSDIQTGDAGLCTAPLLTNETLTVLECSDLFCVYAVAQRVLDMLGALGLGGRLTYADALQIVTRFELACAPMLFMYEPGDGLLLDGLGAKESEAWYTMLCDRSNMYLWEYIWLCQLPRLGKESCMALFSKYSSLSELQTDWDSGKIFQELDGLYGIHQLATLKNHWVTVTKPITAGTVTLKPTKPIINIVLVRVTAKDRLKAQLQERYADSLLLNFCSSVTLNTDFVVTGLGVGSTAKLDKARQEKYKAVITDKDTIIELLDARVLQCRL